MKSALGLAYDFIKDNAYLFEDLLCMDEVFSFWGFRTSCNLGKRSSNAMCSKEVVLVLVQHIFEMLECNVQQPADLCRVILKRVAVSVSLHSSLLHQ